jgi:hypothetical protein
VREAPQFEFEGTLSDEAIETLARLLLELVDREEAERQTERCPEPIRQPSEPCAHD